MLKVYLALVLTGTPFVASAGSNHSQAISCRSEIEKLNRSTAEGQQRLTEKNHVIKVCADQFENSQTYLPLIATCRKYEGQPLVLQQLVADCVLSVYGFANAVYDLDDYSAN